MLRSLPIALCAVALAFPALVFAGKADEMDYGSFISGSIKAAGSNDMVLKARAIRLTSGESASNGAALFDSELCRWAAFSLDGFVNLKGVVYDGGHGANPSVAGRQLFSSLPVPGLLSAEQRAAQGWSDTREIPHGPLARGEARYAGLYTYGEHVAVVYGVGKTRVLDMPGLEQREQLSVFTRSLQVSGVDKPITLLVFDSPGFQQVSGNANSLLLAKDAKRVKVEVAGSGAELALEDDGRVSLTVSKNGDFQLAFAESEEPQQAALETAVKGAAGSTPLKLSEVLKGGPTRWSETVETQGKVSQEEAGYVVDSITIPEKNPYNSWMRIGGFDFFSDGRAALSTWSGDVWIVSGIDEKLEKLTWKRYATGLFHALGLKIVDDAVYVHGRDQITRLHDLNADGEADFYECFNNDIMITQNFHEFSYDLHTDAAGNFYFAKGGPVRPGGSGWDKIVPHHGGLFRLSPDGSKLEMIAGGLRAPNGIGVGPNGELTTCDNEGTWTPKCPINWLGNGDFLGVRDFLSEPYPEKRDPPLCWLPKDVDNSGGGQVWITGEKFGPLSGRLLHMSYGTCTLYLVLPQEVNGVMQGGVAALPPRFDSGICRARFRESENALYLSGLKGWQSRAARDGGFYRVRYTGKPIEIPVGLKFEKEAVRLTFSEPLMPKDATDIDLYNIEMWNYRWTKGYGSGDFKVSDPQAGGHDVVEIYDAKLSEDGRALTLETDPLQVVDQIVVSYSIKSAAGNPLRGKVYATINTQP